ncbi:hypothetical protein AB7M26_005184 [Pseudomonas sp. F-14 TE3482]
MHTTATLHVHPTAVDPFRIFEIRRLARECGCAFIPTKPKQKSRSAPAPLDSNGGGFAA